MTFEKYMHIERFGTDEVQGIELGRCYVFPKIDGISASVWWDDGRIHTGNRDRELSIDNDNAGFHKWAEHDSDLTNFFTDKVTNQTFRLYGEWLVPHSLRTYQDDAWRKFYVFDVWDEFLDFYTPYDDYRPMLDLYGIDYIPPLCEMKNATYKNLLIELENNGYLIKDGEGHGEGIVVKNYGFQNKYGRTTWAKIVTNKFKEKHSKEPKPEIF